MITRKKENLLEHRMRQNEKIYHTECNIFGGHPRVFRYYDQKNEISIDILTSKDSPEKDCTFYSTLGLCHTQIEKYCQCTKPIRFEIAGACYNRYEYFPNLLSSCAFNIINGQFSCDFNTIIEDCINKYVQTSSMKHLLFTTYNIGKQNIPDLFFNDKKVIWLYMIPISNSELIYLKKNSTITLLQKLFNAQIDIYNLQRKSIL